MHIHPHEHSHGTPAMAPDEVAKVLKFMIDHNSHHCEELCDLMDSLPPKAQKRLSIAIGSFEAANVDLQQVLECLES